MENYNNIKIGTDFETFIVDVSNNNKPISAIGICGGSKDEPLSIGNSCFRHEDNVAFEFGMPPCTDFESFKNYIEYCLEKGNQILYEVNPNYTLSLNSSAHFDNEQLDSPKAKEFGCDPALNCYTEEFISNSDLDPEYSLRSFGFHIHLGWEGIENSADLVFQIGKLFDYYLGIPSLVLDPDLERRQLYGKAGEIRWKEYGLEYRSLGSGMLNHLEFVWNNTQKLIETLTTNPEKVSEIVNYMNYNHHIIDNQEVDIAKEICSKFNLIPEDYKVLC